jgi:seryl-tRNA synthetase
MTEESSNKINPDILETNENIKNLPHTETLFKKVNKKTKLISNDQLGHQPDDQSHHQSADFNNSSETTGKKSKKQKKDINDSINTLKNIKQKTKTLILDVNNNTTHSYPLTCDNELIVEDYER